MKIHMADISTTGSRICGTNLGIQVGTVEVYLTTVVMDDLTSLHRMVKNWKRGKRETYCLDAVFEYTEGRRIGDLQRIRFG